jgi:MSHA biogenesis protein MshP
MNLSLQRSQKAFSLVPALFLLIVLASLGAVAVRLTAVQQQTVVLATQGARAYAAARTGINAAAYDALVNGNCGAQSIVLNEGGLSGFAVDTACSSTVHSEGAVTNTVYVIDAFSSAGSYGSPDYVSRRVRATVTDAS